MSNPWQPYSPQRGYQMPPPQPPRRKHRGWIIAAAIVGALLVLGALGSALGKPAPAAKTAAASRTSRPASGPCGRQHWPQPVPRKMVGRSLFHGMNELGCFHLAAAWARGTSRNIMNAPASRASKWVITRVSPAPGTIVKAATPVTLYVRRRHRHPPAAPTPAPPSPIAPPSPAPAATTPAASPAGCYPLSDEGTCYEPGEYCRDADQGMRGVAGDGKSIICEDNDGLRWEPA
jgi:hypothetical protein